MGTLPTGMVAGSYYVLYDAYYQQVDPTNKGTVGAMEAAKFLKRSGLSDLVLSEIWDIADPNNKGYLTKSGFFIALKLIAVVQMGKEISTNNLTLDVPPPNMGDSSVNQNGINRTSPSLPSTLSTSDWTMKPVEKIKYEKLFDSLQPQNGVIPGNKVKGLLMDSKLPIDTLGKIWDLADMDQDGALDRHEFCVAMHLVYKALEKYAIPSCLPPELLPPEKRKDSVPVPGAIQVLPAIPNGVRSVTPEVNTVAPSPPPPLISSVSATPLIPVPSTSQPVKNDWVINSEEKAKYDLLFTQADLDKDGFVSGQEIKNVFLQSGVPQPVLAHIWSLCDTAEEGKLNSEQFALALWLIGRKIKGIDPPITLSPEMVPPSCRGPASASCPTKEMKPHSTPELDALNEEIEKLVQERLTLESNVISKKADTKIKTGEADSLQGELEALVATLKQLENQKGEAQKRLMDLKRQIQETTAELLKLSDEFSEEKAQVEKLRQQADEQDIILKSQELELNQKKRELEDLNKEEETLNKKCADLELEIESLKKSVEEMKPRVEETKNQLSEVEGFHKQLKDALENLTLVIESNDVNNLIEPSLHVEPKFREGPYCGYLSSPGSDSTKIANVDPFSSGAGFTEDSFSSSKERGSVDPFSSKDPFSSEFSSNHAKGGFDTDPFASFGSSGNKPDPFNDNNQQTPAVTSKEEDPFGCDPFAVLHAPPKVSSTSTTPTSPRSESPSPALPPKKSKQPPPRPAPPRPAPPVVQSGFDSNFADFSDFSSKDSSNYGTRNEMQQNKVDLFRDYRYEDPFNIADEYSKSQKNGFPSSASPLPSEEQQLAWATAESSKMEEERKKRAEQEKAELKLAMKLSRSQSKKKSFRAKILS